MVSPPYITLALLTPKEETLPFFFLFVRKRGFSAQWRGRDKLYAPSLPPTIPRSPMKGNGRRRKRGRDPVTESRLFLLLLLCLGRLGPLLSWQASCLEGGRGDLIHGSRSLAHAPASSRRSNDPPLFCLPPSSVILI